MNILFGPYGSLLKSLGLSSDALTIERQEQHLYRNAVELIARGYVKAGATLPTVNAFFLRILLAHGLTDRCRELLSLNLEALLAALGSRKFERIAICLGPAKDCYCQELAPDTVEARYFAQLQYELCLQVLESFSLSLSDVVILHETIGTYREALGIAEAAKSLRIPLILSLIVDQKGRLLDGNSAASAILQIDQATSGFVEGFSLNCCSPYAFEEVARQKNLKECLIGFYPNSWDADPSIYEGKGELPEPRKEDLLKKILEIGRQYNLKFIGGCCGFGYSDIKRLAEMAHFDEESSLSRANAGSDMMCSQSIPWASSNCLAVLSQPLASSRFFS